ncbi:MAG: 8-oxo-dGTP diphosphatase [Lachnospiraceae bacterium]|nr:8-oxo-dGTP diphosphatase [Lachnospiraceae bacterium]
MKQTTLCYIEKNGQYLMLHRNKKANDFNREKWIGVGGKIEGSETPEEGMLREVKEETGLTLVSYAYRGLVIFLCDNGDDQYMHLFTADAYEGELAECDEGELEWVPIERVPTLPLWEGDRIFLRQLAESERFFTLKLVYEGGRLTEHVLRVYG